MGSSKLGSVTRGLRNQFKASVTFRFHDFSLPSIGAIKRSWICTTVSGYSAL